MLDVTAAELSFLKACGLVGSKANLQSGIQARATLLWDAGRVLRALTPRCAQVVAVSLAAEVLCEVGVRPDVVDVLRLKATVPFTQRLNAADVLRVLRDKGNGVVQLPPALPEVPPEQLDWDSAPFGLTAAQQASGPFDEEHTVRRWSQALAWRS